jgi:hypothetical protein
MAASVNILAFGQSTTTGVEAHASSPGTIQTVALPALSACAETWADGAKAQL